MKRFFIVFAMLFLFNVITNAQWEQLKTSNGLAADLPRIKAMAIINSRIVIDDIDNGIYLSDDNGATWRTPSGTKPAINDIHGLVEVHGKLIAGNPAGTDIYISTDKGENWNTLSVGSKNSGEILGAVDGKVFLKTNPMYYSEDDGSTWIATSGLPNNFGVTSIAKVDSTYFVTVFDRVYKSTDVVNWQEVPGAGLPKNSFPLSYMVSSGNNLVVYSLVTGIYYSSDLGDNWTKATGIETTTFFSLYVNNGIIYAGTLWHINVSYDNGATWSVISTSPSQGPTGMTSVIISAPYLIAGTNNNGQGGLWRVQLPTTDIESLDSTIPDNFNLSQNYPNPFNPSTNINFSIPQSSFVTLKIYDILGKEISTLVNEQMSAGIYKFNFDASRLTSGVYFYKITAGTYRETKKMILMK